MLVLLHHRKQIGEIWEYTAGLRNLAKRLIIKHKDATLVGIELGGKILIKCILKI
jgi:hypothetical protein